MAGDFDSYPGDFDSEETPKIAPEETPKTEFAPVSVAGVNIPIPVVEIAALSRDSAVAGEREYVKGRKVLETLGDPEE
jgi:hypothetical protein